MAAVCVRALRRQANRRKALRMAGAIWFLYIRRNHKATRSIWTRPWLMRREEHGALDTLMSELREEDQGSFLNFLRVTPGLFEDLLRKVTPAIQRADTTFQKAISPGMRLAVTMRYLATGEMFKSLSYLFRIANCTIGNIVPETCRALYDVLREDYLTCPSTTEEWEEIAHEYLRHWNFPNCVGALDGNHVKIRQPACSGLKYFNYKHTFSIVLLALVDAKYKFIFVDVGSQGRCSDAGIFAESHLKEALEKNTFSLPAPAPLPGRTDDFPFVMPCDDAFPLKDYLLKPYPHRQLDQKQRIYNYRLSRARRCVENAFGIMANRFRVSLNPICLRPAKVDDIILTCCALHNMLRTLFPNNVGQEGDDNRGRTGQEELPAARVNSRRSTTQSAKVYRNYLCDYFSSPEGSVSWQDSMV